MGSGLGFSGRLGLRGGDLESVEVGFSAVHTTLGLDTGAIDGDLDGKALLKNGGVGHGTFDAATGVGFDLEAVAP